MQVTKELARTEELLTLATTLGELSGSLAQPHTPLPHPHSCRYEDEINKRAAAENEFVGLKKVSGACTSLK